MEARRAEERAVGEEGDEPEAGDCDWAVGGEEGGWKGAEEDGEEVSGCLAEADLRTFQRPLFGAIGERSDIERPVMKSCRIEVGAVGPNECVYLCVYANLVEELQIIQRPEKLPSEDRAEVDELFCAVVETHAQGVRRFDSE